MITSRRVAGVERRALATLALAGASLAVGQFLLVREFVSLLYGEELVIVAVSACFFLGLSVGYGVAARLQPARLQAALALCVGAQLLFPAATRVGAAWMSELAYAGGWLFLWLFGHAIVFAAAPAALLPALLDRRRLVDRSPAARVARLRSSYTAELLGYLAGLALVAACFHRPPATLLALYWSLLVALAWIVGARRRWIAALAVVAAVMTAWLPRLLTATSETVYAFKHGLDGARLRMSIDSPYQRV
ncbi:MAG: hypothetical protein KC636_29610, partial [Myxococcales bacterium]|nr:hypothetical protein [Myxococcales bacterium]